MDRLTGTSDMKKIKDLPPIASIRTRVEYSMTLERPRGLMASEFDAQESKKTLGIVTENSKKT